MLKFFGVKDEKNYLFSYSLRKFYFMRRTNLCFCLHYSASKFYVSGATIAERNVYVSAARTRKLSAALRLSSSKDYIKI